MGELRPSDADLIRRIDIDEDDRAAVAADLGLRPVRSMSAHRAQAAWALLAIAGRAAAGFDGSSPRLAGTGGKDRCAD